MVWKEIFSRLYPLSYVFSLCYKEGTDKPEDIIYTVNFYFLITNLFPIIFFFTILDSIKKKHLFVQNTISE